MDIMRFNYQKENLFITIFEYFIIYHREYSYLHSQQTNRENDDVV